MTTPAPVPPASVPPGPDAGSARPTGGRRRYTLIIGVAAVVLVLDQLSKWWAVNELSTRTIDVFWTLRFNLARNTGAAFSVGRGTDFGRFIPLLALVVVAVVVWQGRTVTNRFGAVAIGMIVGGAIGNLLDRALRGTGGGFLSGGVIDFIDFQWWPIFNVADMGVVVGGILLLVASVFAGPDGDASERSSSEDGSAGTANGANGGGGATTASSSPEITRP
jgi:signal peptidase II